MESGKHDFDGACKPTPGYVGWKTFSVGVFELLANASGSGTKRGPVKVRIVGQCDEAERVYAMAHSIVQQLDAGTYSGPKRIVLKKTKEGA